MIAAFLVNAAIGLVQMTCRVEGVYGVFLPGSAPAWGPTRDDLLESPTVAVMKRLDDPDSATSPGLERIALVPERPFLFGTLLGGPGAFLAFGSLAMPLALAIVLHLISPRGSRESLSSRLSQGGHGSLLACLSSFCPSARRLWASCPGLGFVCRLPSESSTVGLLSAAAAHSRWPALGLTALVLAMSRGGCSTLGAWPTVVGELAAGAADFLGIDQLVWGESLPILEDFPLMGTGLGSFRSIHPYYKLHDATATTADEQLAPVRSGNGGGGPWPCRPRGPLVSLPSALVRESRGNGRPDAHLRLDRVGLELYSMVFRSLDRRATRRGHLGQRPGWGVESLAGRRYRFICRAWVNHSERGMAQGGVDPTMTKSTCLHIQRS